MGKEADIICCNAILVRPPQYDREVAESSINAFAYDPREMCET